MRWNRPRKSSWRANMVIMVTASTLGAMSGCAHMINPWEDRLPYAAAITTPSAEHAMSAEAERSAFHRPYEPIAIGPAAVRSTHWPLYWEDPFEDRGSNDGKFAVTAEDYVAIFYGLGRNLVNTMFLPVSAVVVPPWTVMVSDGVTSRQALGYDHDAEPLEGHEPSGCKHEVDPQCGHRLEES